MLKWTYKAYGELSTEDLFAIYFLRQEVFVVEQECPYQDCDEKDKFSHHLMCFDKNVLVAYLRIVQPGISYPEVSIGRVLTKKTHRNTGLGKNLMNKGIEQVAELYSNSKIRISAQQYLIPFYESLNFVTVGKGYLEDDIPHIEMLYTPK